MILAPRDRLLLRPSEPCPLVGPVVTAVYASAIISLMVFAFLSVVGGPSYAACTDVCFLSSMIVSLLLLPSFPLLAPLSQLAREEIDRSDHGNVTIDLPLSLYVLIDRSAIITCSSLLCCFQEDGLV